MCQGEQGEGWCRGSLDCFIGWLGWRWCLPLLAFLRKSIACLNMISCRSGSPPHCPALFLGEGCFVAASTSLGKGYPGGLLFPFFHLSNPYGPLGLWSILQGLCFSPQFGVTSTAPGLQSSFLPGLHLLLFTLMERHSIHDRCESPGGLLLQIWLNFRSVPAGHLGKKNLRLHFSVKIYFY